ncbi:hypothetical protein F7Q99_00425 [Streptomyces kaniharaensis]|uniref:Murein biosynthesis integral membrane protein MurJ n=1 Tax=Streptomyces kaniharaensis TaxID=212423 RepID=A0A6N7KJ89_9ACTN|nr:lipid II flippase MurJ [Streptomyces kaniharaensis]MQS10785.1 hypothetical protein [Streptomyces kaniharaensis]
MRCGSCSSTRATRVTTLPQAIVTVTLVTALLPHMSRAVIEQRISDLRADLSRALRVSGVVIVPAAFAFLAFGPRIARLLFAHGTTDVAAVLPLGHMLQAFGLGLIPFSAQYLFLRGFYAFDDTRTPFHLSLWISGTNIALATACHLLLPPRWAVTGMAAAYALSYGIGLILTVLRLRRRTQGLLDGRRICRTYGKLTAAAALAGAAGWLVAAGCTNGLAAHFRAPILSLAAGGLTMALLFVLLARLLRIGELRAVPGVR